MSQTPEAAAKPHDVGNLAMLARKLERERDAARSVLLDTVTATIKMQEELNHLRAVCDELAQRIQFGTCVSVRTFDTYNALPHVKARK